MSCCTCTANEPSCLHVSPNKGMKMKTQKKWESPRHVDLHDVSQAFWCLQLIHWHYVKSSDLIKPPEEFFQKHLQQIPPSPRLGVEKVQVIKKIASAKPWNAPARPVTEAVDTEAAAAVLAAEDVHSIGHVAPHGCVVVAGSGRRSARGQLTPAIGLPKVEHMFWCVSTKSNHDSRSTEIELATRP